MDFRPTAGSDLSSLASGKISADIKKLAADVSGLSLMLAGPVRVSPHCIEAPQLKGRLGRGTSAIQASILDYNKAPDARLQARLSELDAAQLLEVKGAAAGPAPAPIGKVPPLRKAGRRCFARDFGTAHEGQRQDRGG